MCVCVCVCVCVVKSEVALREHDKPRHLNFTGERYLMFICCILRGRRGEHVVDVVPGGTELELQLRRGVWQVARTHNNPHVKCTGVY